MALFFHEKHPDGMLIRPVEEVLCDRRTSYQRVTIIRTPQLGRILYLDDKFQSDDVFQVPYHQKMVEIANLGPKSSIVIAGSGPGGLAKECLKRDPETIFELELDLEASLLYDSYLEDWGYDSGIAFQHFVNAHDFDWKNQKYNAVFWDIDADCLDAEGMAACERTFDKIREHLVNQERSAVFVATAGPYLHLEPHHPYALFKTVLQSKFFPDGEFVHWPEMGWVFFRAYL